MHFIAIIVLANIICLPIYIYAHLEQRHSARPVDHGAYHSQIDGKKIVSNN